MNFIRDHASGNQKLLTMVKKSNSVLQVYGGDERIGGLTDKVQHGDKFMIGDINVECLFTPCHTTGHICYYLTVAEQTPAVFTGKILLKELRITLELQLSELIGTGPEKKTYCYVF